MRQTYLRPFCVAIWFFVVMTVTIAVPSWAQIEVVQSADTQQVFAGTGKTIPVVFHNRTDQIFAGEIHARLLQASSTTTVTLKEVSWKNIEVLPGQTVLESAPVDFPRVNAATKFFIQWIAATNRVVGKTQVLVYPTNLLSELKPLVGSEIFGALDPNNELKPLFKQNGVEFLDLEETTLEDFRGKLAVIGPFESKAQMRDGLAQTIQKITSQGVAVVWLQPPPSPRDELKPSFYVVPGNKAAVVIVQPDLVAHFSESSKAQLNLIYFCKLALNPVPFSLPNSPHQQ